MENRKFDNHYDVIIIGSGIGGLIAGNYLAKAKLKTLLIEKHSHLGGYFQGGWHKGYYFDYGTQSHEILGAIFPALEELGIAHRVEFKKIHHRFVSTHGLDFKVTAMSDAKEAFQQVYSESFSALEEYFTYYKHVSDIAGKLNLDGMAGIIRNNNSDFMPDYESYWRAKPYYQEMIEYDAIHSWRKAREFLGKSRVGKLLSHFGYRNQSVLSSGIFWHLWQEDYFYTKWGNQDFVNFLGESFKEFGGTLVTETAAAEIVIDNDYATGVRLANNQVIRSDAVICNADLRYSLETLLQSHPRIYDLLQQVQKTPVSEAFFTAYIGTAIPCNELQEILKDSHHTWFFPTDEKDAELFDITFHKSLPVEISAPVLQNPELAQRGSQVVLQCFSNANWMNRWKITPNGTRKFEYKSLKKTVGEQLVDNASKIIPDLRKRIDFMMFGTPLTHQRYTQNQEGATAGWTWNPKRTLVKLTDQKITTPFKNLFFASHWVLYPGGLLTAAIAGKIAADLVTNKINSESLVHN